MLAQKMAQFCFNENETEQHSNKDSPGEKDAEAKALSSADAEHATDNSEAGSGRGLTKQWSTSSKSSRSSKRGGERFVMGFITSDPILGLSMNLADVTHRVSVIMAPIGTRLPQR